MRTALASGTLDFCRLHNIHLQAWSPLGGGRLCRSDGHDSHQHYLAATLVAELAEVGARFTHHSSIAPTGTISLAFADNASNGIEPAFSWSYTRKKREGDGSFKEFAVEDHAWRLWRHLKGTDAPLPEAFVSALELSARAHAAMVAAVAPYIDTSISKTVNVPEDYPYADFQDLYLTAWRSGLKGLATYRPNSVLGSVLSVDAPKATLPAPLLTDGANTAGTIEPIKAAELAAAAGIRIYTIGVGANEMILPGLFGTNLGARRVNPSADLDEDTLRSIATLTHGRYFRAADTRELEGIYHLLDQLEPTGSDTMVFRPQNSLAHWPLGLALLLSLLLALRPLLPPRASRGTLS